MPDAADVACLDGSPTETITIPTGELVEVGQFDTVQQTLVIDGSLTIDTPSQIDGPLTVNGSLNGGGEVTITGDATIDGTITGLVTIASGADVLGGAVVSGSSTVLTNLGNVAVSGPSFLLANGATVVNENQWTWAGPADQAIAISVPGSSTFRNAGTVTKTGNGNLTLPLGFDFDMQSGSFLVMEAGSVLLAADGTWTGPIGITSEPGTTFTWAGDQTLTGVFDGSSSVDAVGKVVMTGIKRWAAPGGGAVNRLNFIRNDAAPDPAGYQLDIVDADLRDEPFELTGYARFAGTSVIDLRTDVAIDADIAVVTLADIVVDNEAVVTVTGEVVLDGRIETDEFFDIETSPLDPGTLVFDGATVTGSGQIVERRRHRAGRGDHHARTRDHVPVRLLQQPVGVGRRARLRWR